MSTILWVKVFDRALYMSAFMPSHFSCVRLFVTLWIVACQALLSMGFSRQEYWSGLSCLPPGDFPGSGIEPKSMSSVMAGWFFNTSTTWEAHVNYTPVKKKKTVSQKGNRTCKWGAEREEQRASETQPKLFSRPSWEKKTVPSLTKKKFKQPPKSVISPKS